MGAWGSEPWDNDLAADWFHSFFKGIDANARIRKAFKDPNDIPVIQGGCFLLGCLGRPYVRPGDLNELKQLLDQGISLLSRMAKPTAEDLENDDFLEYWEDAPEFLKAMQGQLTQLRKRRAELQG
jgi:hypothetical protein